MPSADEFAEWSADQIMFLHVTSRVDTDKYQTLLKDKGFLSSNAGAHGNVIKLRPPLVFDFEHADAFLRAYDATLTELA